MNEFLNQYAILISFSSPLGLTIQEYTLARVENIKKSW